MDGLVRYGARKGPLGVGVEFLLCMDSEAEQDGGGGFGSGQDMAVLLSG
ncbi:hypothetical protein P3T27_002797 [Kitasatospora sp. MAA19]|nr:hypothetical protein [Kitasatospora sp. MAA19]